MNAKFKARSSYKAALPFIFVHVRLQEGDSSEVAALKQSLLALMITFQERLDSTEAVQQQQTRAIQASTFRDDVCP